MTGELYQIFKEDSISIIYKFFKQIEEEETFLKLTLWGQHYFDTKTMQRLQGKKQQMKIFMNTDANNQQNTSKPNPAFQKDLMIQVEFISKWKYGLIC